MASTTLGIKCGQCHPHATEVWSPLWPPKQDIMIATVKFITDETSLNNEDKINNDVPTISLGKFHFITVQWCGLSRHVRSCRNK